MSDALPHQTLLPTPRGSPGTLPRGPCSPGAHFKRSFTVQSCRPAAVGRHTWASCFVSWQLGAHWSEGHVPRWAMGSKDLL